MTKQELNQAALAETQAAETATQPDQAKPDFDSFRESLDALDDPNAHPLLVFLDPQISKPLYRAAQLFAQSQLVPKHFRGQPNDCFLVLQAAGRMRVDPLLMLQKTYIVHGKPGFESTFLISLVNQRGGFSHELRFRMEGEPGTDQRRCTAWTTAKDGTIVEAPAVTMEMARAEDWTKNPKYRTMPDLMLTYRAGGLFSRIFCPHVTMGFHTVDELRDVQAAEGEEPKNASDQLREAFSGFDDNAPDQQD